jgi:hypothetical protein
MKINVFEGSRRIGYLIQGLWVIGCIWAAIAGGYSIYLRYDTSGPNYPFVLSSKDDYCGSPDASQTLYDWQLNEDKKANIRLCFLAQTSNQNQQVVPYKVEANGSWYGNGPYSSEVSDYTKVRARKFNLSPQGREDAAKAWDKEWWNHLAGTFKLVFGGWFVISLTIGVIGWIVRGFCGIPFGQDNREK